MFKDRLIESFRTPRQSPLCGHSFASYDVWMFNAPPPQPLADPAARFGGGGGQKFWRVKPNLPPFSTFSSDFGHFIFKTQNFNNFYFMFNFYINFCQIPQALRSELAYLAEGPSLAIKRHSLTSRRLLTRALQGGGGKKNALTSGFSRIAEKRRRAAPPFFSTCLELN